MSNLIVSLNENILKISLSTPESFKSISAEVNHNLVDDTQILDVKGFADAFSGISSELANGHKKDRTTISFLVEPQDVIFKFIMVNKRDGDSDEKIIEEIKNRLESVELESLYFSYQKIAPFVYQFVGINKEQMENYLEVSNILGIELKSIVPWIMLLPSYIGRNEPSIFVSKKDEDQIIALSELNGIYYCQVFEHEKSHEELSEIISQLSIYKRVAPITKIYSLNGDTFSLDPKYETVPLIPRDQITPEIEGYELHALYNKMAGEDPNILTSQLNILNMLPLPVVESKPNAIVYAGATLAVLLTIGGGAMFYVNSKSSNANQAVNPSDSPSVVLSENVEVTPTVVETPQEEVQLDKKAIRIHVDNAAGIPGLAAKTQNYLQTKGWEVPSIDTAEETDRASTLIKIKSSKKQYLELLKTDMSGEYEVTTDETLDESLDYDVLVLVGQN